MAWARAYSDLRLLSSSKRPAREGLALDTPHTKNIHIHNGHIHNIKGDTHTHTHTHTSPSLHSTGVEDREIVVAEGPIRSTRRAG